MDNLTNEDMLDDMLLDLYITRLKYRAYSSVYAWQKWIRES